MHVVGEQRCRDALVDRSRVQEADAIVAGQVTQCDGRMVVERAHDAVAIRVRRERALLGCQRLLEARERLQHHQPRCSQAAGDDVDGVQVIAGGKKPQRFAKLAEKLGIAHAVTFLGLVDPVPYYAAADVFVHPTWYDPCSLVTLEASSSGLPVITSRFNGAAELMIHGKEGFVLPDPGDVTRARRANAGSDGTCDAGENGRSRAHWPCNTHLRRSNDTVCRIERKILSTKRFSAFR